jgi:hypothetical protein
MQISASPAYMQQTPSQTITTDNGQNTAPQSTKNLTDTQDLKTQEILTKLEARDSEVRAHEAAHIAAGSGVVTGGASFSYQKGPDGKMYAIGGEVPIDASKESTPEATIAKMQQVKAAALAPANPSPTDVKVASTASMMESKARQELQKQEQQMLQAQAKQEYPDISRKVPIASQSPFKPSIIFIVLAKSYSFKKCLTFSSFSTSCALSLIAEIFSSSGS